MAKILVDDIWYEQLSATSLYEIEFEHIILQRSGLLFPYYYVVPFKKTVFTEESSARADLAFIEKRYQEWWVVEVELGQHSFHSHVLPQVQTLSRAQYGFLEAKYLCEQSAQLNCRRLEDMMKGIQPRVLVIVNTSSDEWIEPLSKYDALLTVIELFRSERNEYICWVNGESPKPNLAVVSECQVDPYLQTFLMIHSPATLNVIAGENVEIIYRGTITEWQRIDVRDAVFLVFKGKENPLKKNSLYVLLQNSDGKLEIKRKHVQSRR